MSVVAMQGSTSGNNVLTMKRENIRPSKKETNKAVTMLILKITLQWYGLYGAVVSVIATGSKGCVFEAGQGDGF
jgi:hypothetical protein